MWKPVPLFFSFLIYFQNFPPFGHFTKPIKFCMSQKQTNKMQKEQQLCLVSLSICGYCVSLMSKFQKDYSTCSFHLLTPPSSLYVLCPVTRPWLHVTPEEGLSQISPGTSSFLNKILFTSQLLIPLCNRRHCPKVILYESLPSPGFGVCIFVGYS